VLLREGNGALLAAESVPPEIFEVGRKGQVGFIGRLAAPLKLIRALRRERFDLVIDLRGDERGGYMAFSTGAPVRAAEYYKRLPRVRNLLFTHLAALPNEKPAEGATEQYLRLLRAFGIKTGNVAPELHLSAGVSLRAADILTGEGIGLAPGGERRGAAAPPSSGGWVTMNPFSRWSYKEWHSKKWVKIIDWLWSDLGMATVIVGSPQERVRAAALIGESSGRAHNLAGKTTLGELAGVIQKSRLHIGVDSAAPHIAAAVSTATVTLYGPSDWRYWAQPGRRHRVVTADMDCVPCRQKGCDGREISRCLDALEVTDVQTAIREVLSEG
jgi:heptosyltransferase-3